MAIFVQPPSLEVLIERLTARGTDSEEKIAERITKAEKELSYASKFDIVLENNELTIACAKAEELVSNFMNNKE